MFGFHVKIKPDFNNKNYKTLENAIVNTYKEYPFINSIQIFTHGPRHKYKNKYNPLEIKQFINKNKIALYVHSPYIPTDGIWTGLLKNETKYLNHLQELVDSANEINARGLVIHITKQLPETILKVMTIIQKKIKNLSNLILILEMKAMKPHPLMSYETPEKCNNLCNILKNIKIKWGLCIDFSHIWACGINISDKNIIKKWFNIFKYHNKIKLFHLNSASYNTYSRGKDIHIIPFSKYDNIWNNVKNSSFELIIKYAKKNKIPLISEVNRGTQKELEYFLNILNKLL